MTPIPSHAWLRSSLLDRLTDHNPETKAEALHKQYVDEAELRRLLCRDLTWLFSATQLSATLDLASFPEVSCSVLNYGMPNLTGHTLSDVDSTALEQRLLEALSSYEPRLLRDTIQISVIPTPENFSKPALFIEIRAVL